MRERNKPIQIFDLTLPEPSIVSTIDCTCFAFGFSPDENALTLALQGGEIRSHRPSDGELIHTYKPWESFWSWGFSIAYNADGRLLASGHESGTVFIWDNATHKQIAALVGNRGAVRQLAFFPDSKRVAVGCDHEVRIWNLQTQQELSKLPLSSPRLFSLDVSSDGHHVLALSEDGCLTIWTGAPYDESSNETLSGELLQPSTMYNRP